MVSVTIFGPFFLLFNVSRSFLHKSNRDQRCFQPTASCELNNCSNSAFALLRVEVFKPIHCCHLWLQSSDDSGASRSGSASGGGFLLLSPGSVAAVPFLVLLQILPSCCQSWIWAGWCCCHSRSDLREGSHTRSVSAGALTLQGAPGQASMTRSRINSA